MEKIKIYYRISDNSYPKTKLIGATKEVCLRNFCHTFSEAISGQHVEVVCDNCHDATIKLVQDLGLPHIITADGNAGSLRLVLELALKHDENTLIYSVEDDYLHLPIAPILLQEGIKRADYVTLYDHPDKYTRVYNGGEHSKVIRTATSHWRYTASTCMTFCTMVKTLREDIDVWLKHTDGPHPHDHRIFIELGKKQRRLAVCIPGVACHTDLAFSKTMSTMLIDAWAIDLMIAELEKQLSGLKLDSNEEYHLMRKSLDVKCGKEKLMALDALRLYFSAN